MKFQQRLKALQFQRYDFMARTSRGGIACDIPCTPSSDVREGRMQGLRGLAAVPAGSGKAWPDNEPTRRAAEQRPGPTGVEGAGGTGGQGGGFEARRRRVRRARPRCRWVAAGPGCGARGRWRGPAAVPVGGGRARAGLEIDHSEPSGSRVAISRAGRRPPAHTAAGPHKASQRSARNTSGTTSNTTTRHRNTTPGIQKTDIRIGCQPVVELGGFEPPTFSLRTRRATNCAIAPRTQTA